MDEFNNFLSRFISKRFLRMTSELVQNVGDNVVGHSFSALETTINDLAGFDVIPLVGAVITYVVLKHTGIFTAIGLTASLFQAINRIVYKVLEGVITKVAETMLSNALLGRSLGSRVDISQMPPHVMEKIEEAYNEFERD